MGGRGGEPSVYGSPSGQSRLEGERPPPFNPASNQPLLPVSQQPGEQPSQTPTAQETDNATIAVNEHKDGMMNTTEQRWKDFELITTVKNMLLCIERQYSDFHGGLAKCRDALTKGSKERKKEDKDFVKVEDMEYQSKKMEHLLKRFHVEIKTPDERYEHETTKAKWWRIFKTGLKCARAIIHIAGGNFAMITNSAWMDG